MSYGDELLSERIVESFKQEKNKFGKSGTYKKAYDDIINRKDVFSWKELDVDSLVPKLERIEEVKIKNNGSEFETNFVKVSDVSGTVYLDGVNHDLILFKQTDSPSLFDNLVVCPAYPFQWFWRRNLQHFVMFKQDFEPFHDQSDFNYVHIYGSELSDYFEKLSYEQRASMAIQILSRFDIDKQSREEQEVLYTLKENAIRDIRKHLYDKKCECAAINCTKNPFCKVDTEYLDKKEKAKIYAEIVDATNDLSLSDMLQYCEDECDKVEVQIEIEKAKKEQRKVIATEEREKKKAKERKKEAKERAKTEKSIEKRQEKTRKQNEKDERILKKVEERKKLNAEKEKIQKQLQEKKMAEQKEKDFKYQHDNYKI